MPLSQWHKDALNDPKLTDILKPLRDQLAAMGVNPGAPLTFEHFYDQVIPRGAANAVHALALNEYMEPFRPCLWERAPSGTAGTISQKLEQCWFPGDHTDVCGGVYGDQQIADITLAWMMSQLEKLKVLKFKPGYIKQAFEDSKRIAQRDNTAMQKWGRGKQSPLIYHFVWVSISLEQQIEMKCGDWKRVASESAQLTHSLPRRNAQQLQSYQQPALRCRPQSS